MYSVRPLLRSCAREVPCLNRYLAHSRMTKAKDRRNTQHERKKPSEIMDQSMGFTPDELREIDHLSDDEVNISAIEGIYDAYSSEKRWRESKCTLAEYGQKYYKPKKEPALLSSDDIKQIRKLHSDENWPINTLAKSFPASELIIKKVLKSSRNSSLQDQFKHDEKVARNWVLLRKGDLEISDELRQHCLKFANRVTRPLTSKDLAIMNAKPSRPPGSFLSLIKPPDTAGNNEMQDQGRKNDDDKKKEKKLDSDRHRGSDSVLQHLREIITLEEARKRELESIADCGIGVDEDVKSFVCGPGPSKDILPDGSENDKSTYKHIHLEQSVATKEKKSEFISKWSSSGRSAKASKDAMMAPIDDYPEQISIPETAKKPGAIYRVEDCFYNEDGEFMYRVPGLKS